ncbi:MAG TPA: XTP/dITP diphosphatase [Armatimonadota bacterium]|nr:XTP/dITP diphosphatase [Armatimonadota bacterium]HOM71616.1 XTP/dITP diphosphatase [Armatimonadota bacterium]HPP76436.1 XTP/dITP diphosphatase [Armatimonadota bacterium]
MRILVIATGNPGKAREISRILADLDFDIRTLKDYPPMPEPEENAETFAGNAEIKALAAANHTGELAIADDSGLVVDALDGAPGVYSSRFAGENATDEERNEKVLQLLKDIPDDQRTARFVAVAAIAEPGRIIATTEGKVEGIIAREPKGSNGFGYDPIFYVPEFGKTTAELSSEQKDAISHRGEAFRKAKEVLRSLD